MTPAEQNISKKEPPDQNPEVKAYCLSSFQKVRCGFIGDVRDPGQQEGCISVACVADGIAAAGRTHVTVDGCCFICLQLHKLLYQINRFGSMPAKTVLLLNGVAWDLLPGAVDFLVPHILLIEIDLTQIMEECRHNNAFFSQLKLVTGDCFLGHVVNI